jgi:hypothetical protein
VNECVRMHKITRRRTSEFLCLSRVNKKINSASKTRRIYLPGAELLTGVLIMTVSGGNYEYIHVSN